jgi:hypothetical protein
MRVCTFRPRVRFGDNILDSAARIAFKRWDGHPLLKFSEGRQMLNLKLSRSVYCELDTYQSATTLTLS